jgi:hypothetical protein
MKWNFVHKNNRVRDMNWLNIQYQFLEFSIEMTDQFPWQPNTSDVESGSDFKIQPLNDECEMSSYMGASPSSTKQVLSYPIRWKKNVYLGCPVVA